MEVIPCTGKYNGRLTEWPGWVGESYFLLWLVLGESMDEMEG